MEEKKNESLLKTLISIPGFWKEQQRDWKVTVIRTSFERLGYHVVFPYLSLYIIALGAQKSQLGLITSVSMLLGGIIGPMCGRFIDRNGAKRLYVAGIVMLLASYLLYATAPGWEVCALAMVIYYLGNGTSIHSCATICGNCLRNCDRAKGMLVCESLAAGLLGMMGPIIASWVLVNVIGVNEAAAGSEELKYLFYISAFFTLVSLIVVLARLSNQRWATNRAKNSTGLKDGLAILRENKNARKWIAIAACTNMPTALILPYFQIYASEVHGASVTLLAAMVSAAALTSVFCGYPVGALADRFGRKKVLFVIIPLFWLSNILLLASGRPALLIMSGVLQGFYYIGSPLASAMQRELVSQEVMGTWIGVVRMTNAISSAVMAALAGIIYEKIGPAYVFILYVGMDMLIRLPLLMSLPETLNKTVGEISQQ